MLSCEGAAMSRSPSPVQFRRYGGDSRLHFDQADASRAYMMPNHRLTGKLQEPVTKHDQGPCVSIVPGILHHLRIRIGFPCSSTCRSCSCDHIVVQCYLLTNCDYRNRKSEAIWMTVFRAMISIQRLWDKPCVAQLPTTPSEHGIPILQLH